MRFALGMRSSASAVLIVVFRRHSGPFQAHVLQNEQNGHLRRNLHKDSFTICNIIRMITPRQRAVTNIFS